MKKYRKVGYVKFISKKSRTEIEKEEMVFTTDKTKKFIVDEKTNQCLFSREEGERYPIIVVYSTDRNFLHYYDECECRNITEISKNCFKYKNIKILQGYHLYRANIYHPTIDELQIIEDYEW